MMSLRDWCRDILASHTEGSCPAGAGKEPSSPAAEAKPNEALLAPDELEKQLLQVQKLAAVGVLAGRIAHDLNNLMMGISGNLELLRLAKELDAASQKYMDNALDASRRAANLSSQMLAFSRKGSQGVKSVDLNRLVAENLELMKGSMRKGISLSTRLDPELPSLQAEPGQMQQLIVNLVTNAAEALGETGAIGVSTGVGDLPAAEFTRSRVEPKPASGRFVFIDVSDSGCGMDGETSDRMFDPFFSIKAVGRGLGLTAVQAIVKASGGAILVDTASGEGTTVRVLLPAP
ncbi:two-component system sensor histidine kinase NtrB [Citrifermentans bremense]|uniref:two-component system sensor histidine kinase NtrB n=1 Tax=Citrifermentans bremense TaxID=60035 RepID=UPI00047E6BB9|nr:ATP-binding protein [Citrifermentans bremense]